MIVRGEAGQGFCFYIGNQDTGQVIRVAEGFASDGPSIPAALRRILPRPLLRWVRACLTKAAIVHDRLREDLQYTLIDCDAYFLVAMSADLKNWTGPRWARILLREIAFAAVRTNRSRIQHNAALAA